MKLKLAALVCLVSSLSAFAEGKITLHVELSPAGSFEASSGKIEGQLIKKHDLLVFLTFVKCHYMIIQLVGARIY